MHSRLFPRFVISALVLFVASVFPALTGAQNRINNTIGDAERGSVRNTVPPRARMATDLGLAPTDRALQSLTFRFSMTSAQQAALTQLLQDQQNPNSPSYHQWLTPEQFGARFGLSAADLAKVSTWLTSQGFTVTSTARSSTSITFSGTVGQVQRAFGTSLHTVSADGEQHIANLSDPTLPSPIAGVVLSITGLNDFKLKSRARVSTVAASTAADSAVHPQYTSSVSSVHYIAPGDLYTIYDMNQLISNQINGSGMTIAVVGQTDISLSDVAAFRSASGLPANAPTVKLYGTDPGPVSGDLEEASLDVEWSGAAAPSAAILYVNSTDVLNTSLPNAIENNLAPIVSISYGLCENAATISALDSFNQLFQQANAQGITIVGPSGDSGATDCDYQFATATQGLAVDFPASSPFVTSAGGTMFNEGSATGATPYWNAANGNFSGSAISYIPETVWNESNSTGLGAGGGGASAYFTKPAWQVGTGVPADFARDVPDIALNSASGHDGYLFCASTVSQTNVLTPWCTNGFRNSAGTLDVVGGTSVAAPTFAGILALVEQKIGSRLGNANYGLYALANSQYYNMAFHDVSNGNNNSPCAIGTTNCPNGGSIGYSATQDYDLATGWGSVDAYNLATKWTLVTPPAISFSLGLISATTVTTPSPACGVSTGNLVLNVSIKNGSVLSAGAATPPAPTGTIQFLVDNVAVGSPVPLVNGALQNYTFNTNALTSGGHTISAAYSGDNNYAGSKGVLTTDIVSATNPDFSLTPCTPSTTVRTGGTAPAVTFTLTPFKGFTGSIALSAVADTPLSASYVFSLSPVVISSASGVTTTFTLTASQSNATTTNGLIKLPSGGSAKAGRSPWYAAGSGTALACVLLFTLPRRRRWGALLAIVLSVSAITAIGCGGSSSSSSSSSGGTSTPTTTPATPGTYNITITGVATTSTGNIVHSANVTFIVTQ